MSEESDWMKDQRRHWQADHEAALKIAAHRDAPGARGEIGSQPTAPGANGPNGWPQHPVSESLYESCIATRGAISELHETYFGGLNRAIAMQDTNAPRVLTEVEILRADRDAWSARCAALMTELDKVAAVSAELSLMVVRMRKRAEAAEQRLSERDGPMKWLSSRNPPT